MFPFYPINADLSDITEHLILNLVSSYGTISNVSAYRAGKLLCLSLQLKNITEQIGANKVVVSGVPLPKIAYSSTSLAIPSDIVGNYPIILSSGNIVTSSTPIPNTVGSLFMSFVYEMR